MLSPFLFHVLICAICIYYLLFLNFKEIHKVSPSAWEFPGCLACCDVRFLRFQVFVIMRDLESSQEFRWSKEKFINRSYLMKEMYQNYEEGEDWNVSNVCVLSWVPFSPRYKIIGLLFSQSIAASIRYLPTEDYRFVSWNPSGNRRNFVHFSWGEKDAESGNQNCHFLSLGNPCKKEMRRKVW